MVTQRVINIWVGVFLLCVIMAVSVLIFKVSNVRNYQHGETYQLTAAFDDLGGIKPRAPVRISGVRIGEVASIVLDKKSYRALAVLSIDKQHGYFPVDTAASILTEGVLGAHYISLAPGYESEQLHDGDRIHETHSALILEKMIGHLLFSLKDKK